MRWMMLLILMVVVPARSQDWAKARLEKSPRHLEFVTVQHDGRKVQCFVAYPEVRAKAPAVLVIHEIFGLSDWVRGVCDQLAEAGYVTIAPDLLSGLGPKGGGTAELGGDDAARRAISGLPPTQVTADLKAAAAYVRALPACNGTLAVGGFCWGGGQAFRFATDEPGLKAAYVFYGSPPEAADMPRIACPVYGFYAENDARIGATIPGTKEAMARAGKIYEPVIYPGAGHGFMRAGEAPDANDANRDARDHAWERWKDLLKRLRELEANCDASLGPRDGTVSGAWR